VDKINVAMAVVLVAAASAFGQADEKSRAMNKDFGTSSKPRKKAAESAATPE